MILFACIVVFALAGCDTPTDRTRAEADRLRASAAIQSAEAARLASAADLAAVEAISSTLSVQSGQINRLTDQVIESARLWQDVAVSLAGALCLTLAVIVLAVLRRPQPAQHTTVYTLPRNQPLPLELDQSPDWSEVRAMRLAAQRHEVEARRALVVVARR